MGILDIFRVREQESPYALSLTGFARGLMNPPPAEPASERSAASNARSPEAQALFDYKAQALEMAKAMAAERERGFNEAKAAGLGAGSTPNFTPTMTDYFIAAAQLGEAKKEEMAQRGVQWSPAVIADLSGQQIDGFQINKADMEPRREAILLAAQRAKTAAQSSGTQPTLTDTLRELQAIQQSGEKLPSLKDLEDAMDLDGNGTLAFYEAIDRHADFKGTVFSNVSFHPAGTLMPDGESGVVRTDGATFKNVTFDGMGADDNLTFVGKQFNDITFTNIKGGSITIPDGAQVNGMDIRGAYADLHIGHASVSNLDASDARIVTFTTADGAEISHSKFNGTTIGMGSQLNGSKWTDVEFNDANLGSVDMRNVTLSNVRINKSNTEGLDLSGATIDNLSINGVLIQNARQLNDLNFGIKIDESTAFHVDPELIRQQDIDAKTRAVADIGKVLAGQMNSIGSPSAPRMPESVAQAPLEVAATTAISRTAITFGGDADMNSVGLTAAVASQPRTIDPNEVATPMNMQRNSST